MKKLFVLVAVFTTILVSSASAQGGGGNFDPAAAKARYLETSKPTLIEKTKLSATQADKVLEINWTEVRMKTRGLRDLSEDERTKKRAEAQAEANKQYKAIPLTDDQIKAVNDFFEQQRANRPQGGGGGN